MYRRRFGLMLAIGVAVTLAVAVSSASANKVSVSARSFRATWSPITISEPEIRATHCPMTLEGTFHSSTIAKVARALIGHVTRATIYTAACEAEPARVKTETLPWHVQYESFTGTLPNITGVRLRVVGETIEAQGCTFRSTETSPARYTAVPAGGTIATLNADETAFLPLAGGGLSCPGSIRLLGNASVTVLGTTARIGLTLI